MLVLVRYIATVPLFPEPHVPLRTYLLPASMVMRRSRGLAVLFVVSSVLLSCHGSPTAPGEALLATGRWTGDGACLAVSDTGCNLAVGCGHGQFPRPIIRSDGTFDID